MYNQSCSQRKRSILSLSQWLGLSNFSWISDLYPYLLLARVYILWDWVPHRFTWFSPHRVTFNDFRTLSVFRPFILKCNFVVFSFKINKFYWLLHEGRFDKFIQTSNWKQFFEGPLPNCQELLSFHDFKQDYSSWTSDFMLIAISWNFKMKS